MKLNKLTSAVSVSLLAVALTACGSDDDAPIVNTTTTTPAPTPAPTPAVTPAPADNTANIAALTAAFKAAGLSDAKAAELAAANPTIAAGSAEFTALVNANQPATNTGTNTAVSEVVRTHNPYIKGVNTENTATVTANQYTRQDGSTFDRSANPTAYGALGAVGTDDPTATNPYLSNYVLGVEVSGGKIVAIDSTGELVTADGSALVAATDSPYATRDGYIYTTDSTDSNRTYQYSTALETVSAPSAATTVKNYKKDVKHNAGDAFFAPGAGRSGFVTNVVTIQDINQDTTLVSPEAAVAAEAAAGVAGRTAPATGWTGADHVKTGLLVYTATSPLVGNTTGRNQGLKDATFGVEENIYQVNRDGKLTAINTAANTTAASAITGKLAYEITQTQATPAQNTSTIVEPATYAEARLSGLNNASLTSNDFETRVFGKNYKSTEVGASGSQSYDNSYVGRYTSANVLNRVATTKLHNVQYGRLTNNIDVLDTASASKSNAIVYRQFQQHGAANTVDTYFYRGTNHTSLDDMKALQARGGTYQYYGHALTYGIGPKKTEAASNGSLPTAYGLTSSEATIGNFVEAKFDAASSKVTGNIYNFINNNVGDSSSKFTKQDLVSFSGDVYGNTATGTATKLGATTETGSFTGSFFGPNAQELGGSISSITRDQGYSTPKWGAVFGATKGTAVENFNVIERQGGN